MFATVALCCLSACAVQPIIHPIRMINVPEVGALETRAIGETLVQSGEVRIRPTVELRDPIVLDQGFQGWIVPAGDYGLYSQTEDIDIYVGPIFAQGLGGPAVKYCKGTDCPVCGGICVNRGDGRVTNLAVNGICGFSIKENRSVSVNQRLEVSDLSDTREFIFSGRSGNTLRFRYREYRAEEQKDVSACQRSATKLLKDGFTQDLTYDLTDGNVVGFRNLRLEILKVTNTDITYRLLSFF